MVLVIYWISKNSLGILNLGMCAYLAKLPEQLNEGAFAKRVSEACMESQGGILMGQNSHPSFLVQIRVETKSQSHSLTP